MGKFAIGSRIESDHVKPLRNEKNVLVPVRVGELANLSSINLWLALASVVYFAVNVVCCILNGYERGECVIDPNTGKSVTPEGDPCVDGETYVTTDDIFHRTEFGATFLFSIVETLCIVYSPERQFESELLLKALCFWNIAVSGIPALLVFINLEKFEVPSHQIEYANGLGMALVDALMALQLVNQHNKAKRAAGREVKEVSKLAGIFFIGVIPLGVAAAQLGVYNGLGVEDGEHLGETPAHYLEFVFEMISSLITFWFCMDNRLQCQTMRLDIMLAEGDETVILVRDSRVTAGEGSVLGRFSQAMHVPLVVRNTDINRGTDRVTEASALSSAKYPGSSSAKYPGSGAV